MTPWTALSDGARPVGCAPSRGADLAPQRPYESRFADWYDAASLRTRPPLDASAVGGQSYFPPDLAPILQHPLVESLGPARQREGQLQCLFSYLTFTDRLEDEVVNRSARRIARGAVDLPFAAAMRLDAYKIYCDEGYHSLLSADLMAQLAAREGFAYDGGSGHPALTYFHAKRASFDSSSRRWFDLFFAIVSETLISASLLRIPRDPDLLPAVRHLVGDHAADECRHHSFFSEVCQLAWPRVPSRIRHALGTAIPRCIAEFLDPDTPAMMAFLVRYLGRRRAADVVAEAYPLAARQAHARSACRASLRVFEQAGLLEDTAVVDAFAAHGLASR